MKEQGSDNDFHETIINLIVKFSVIEKMLIDKGIFSKEDYLKELELLMNNVTKVLTENLEDSKK
tara:strand:- start:8656 stop:8847 length:192 start_codon:yes stop_codon:yes gene_type:complete